MNNVSLRSEIYLLLSEAFKKPTPEFATELPDVTIFLRSAFTELKYDISEDMYSNLPNLAAGNSPLTEAYHQSFIYPVHSRVVPVESIYRRWTHDASAQVPFAADKGLLMSDHALHMKTLYDAYGITIPEEYQSMPDHLCLELEFAAFLLQNEIPERFRLFLDEHLTWLGELAQDSVNQAIPAFYVQLIKLTAQFLNEEMRRYGSLKS